MMKRAMQWSAFFLAVVALGFLLQPIAVRIVRAANEGVSSGYNPAGLYWSRPYTRFIPSEYETGAAIAFDLGAAVACVSGLFYGITLLAQRKSAEFKG
jgi:glucose uptake protein GlcU